MGVRLLLPHHDHIVVIRHEGALLLASLVDRWHVADGGLRVCERGLHSHRIACDGGGA